MNSENTNECSGNFQMHRRQYLLALGAGTTVAVAGCSGDTDDSSGGPSENTDTEQSCTDEYSEQFCESEDFVVAVKERLQSLSGTPEVLGTGVYLDENNEPVEDRVVMEIVPDTENLSELSEDVGYVAGAFAYHIEDYSVRRMDVSVLGDSEGEEYLGRFHILAEWAEANVNGEMTTEEYVSRVMETTVPAE